MFMRHDSTFQFVGNWLKTLLIPPFIVSYTMSTYENWTERGEVGQGRRDTKTVKFQAKFQPQTDPMSSSEHKLHLRVVLA